MAYRAFLRTRRARDYAKKLADELPDTYFATFREAKRSDEQNALLWKLLTDLSEQVPWSMNGVEQKLSPEDWKDLATAALKKEQRVAAGMDGGFVFLGRRTSNMSKRTFSDLLEVIFAFGSQHGVEWSMPDPRENSDA